jgi:hypothetical protein
MKNIYFATFHTEGPPVDKCYNLRETAKEIKTKLTPFFDNVFVFNKTSLKQLIDSDDICNEYEESLDMNPNANYIGYFDFKPFIIDHVLKQIPKNSILIYHDGNFEKNPQYWESDWENIYQLSNKLLDDNKSDIFVQIERDGITVKEYVKTYTIDQIITNPVENKIVKNCRLINAARLIVKNTEFTKNFIKEYLNLCKNKAFIGKSPNPHPDQAFKWSCGDQDVLNCLIYKYILEGKLNSTFPMYSFLYRVIRFENKPFNWPNQSWNPHPTGASVLLNDELIQYMKDKNGIP